MHKVSNKTVHRKLGIYQIILTRLKKSFSPKVGQKELWYYKGLYGIYGLSPNQLPESLGAAALVAEVSAAVVTEASMASICSKSETRHDAKTTKQQQWRKNMGLWVVQHSCSATKNASAIKCLGKSRALRYSDTNPKRLISISCPFNMYPENWFEGYFVKSPL